MDTSVCPESPSAGEPCPEREVMHQSEAIEVLKAIGCRLREARLHAGLSQEAVSPRVAQPGPSRSGKTARAILALSA